MARDDSSASPHVALFLPHLGGGGTEKMVVTLANGLAARGYAVDMVLVQARGVYRQLLSPTIRVIDLSARNSYLALPGLAAYLRHRHPTVLVSSLSLTNLIALIARWVSGARTRVAIRMESTVSAQRRVHWKKLLEKPLLSWLYPHAERIIAVSRAVAADAAGYLNIPLNRMDVIYNPVITGVYQAPAAQSPVHPWFAPGCPPVVLGVGRLVAVKDFPTLIRAFADVRRQKPARLIILGEGELRDSLLGLAEELSVAQDVDLPGFVQDAHSFMSNCRAFVLSSIYEGLPTVLIEALASGCAVVSTDCPGGSREILADGAYGELVSVGDVGAMSAAIRSILDGSRKHVDPAWLQQFTLDTVIDRTVSVLGLPPNPR